MYLRLIEGPVVEPVSVEEAENYCHADADTEDDWFAQEIASAREDAETIQRRAYITQTWELSLDGCPSGIVQLPRPPIQSVTSVKIYDENNEEHDIDLDILNIDTDSEPGRIKLKRGRQWPNIVLRELNSFKVLYVAGYGATAVSVPANVKTAIMIRVSHFWNNRDSEKEIPNAFKLLLKKNRVPVI